MALAFQTKMKTDLLNAWGASKKLYIAGYNWESGHYYKKCEGDFTLSATPATTGATNGKITYSTPINMVVGDDSTISMIILFDAAPPNSFDEGDFPTSMLASEGLSPRETFTYGGTFRINQIVIELV